MQLLMVTLYLVICALVMRVFTIKLGMPVIRLLDSAFCCTKYIYTCQLGLGGSLFNLQVQNGHSNTIVIGFSFIHKEMLSFSTITHTGTTIHLHSFDQKVQ